MNLVEYLLELERLLASRSDTKMLLWTSRLLRGETHLTVRARVQFADSSLLEFSETVVLARREAVNKLHYSYHYQRGEQVVFRYDNAPHFPALAGFPNHKHVGESVEGAAPPNLADVLQEIDAMSYPGQ